MAEPTSDNSATAGILRPIGALALYDDEFVDQLQPWIAAVSGLDGKFVRPKWQTGDVPNMPGFEVDWIALGIPRFRADTFPAITHDPDGEGFDVLGRSEEHDLLISCYGPLSASIACVIRDGIMIEQNRVPLHTYNTDVVSVGDVLKVPALVNAQWQKRHNVTVTLRRYVERRYGVLTVLSLQEPIAALYGIDNEQYITPIFVDEP